MRFLRSASGNPGKRTRKGNKKKKAQRERPKKIFTEDKDNIGYTVKYKGFKRLLVNFIAAATFAKYDWN